jgi:uncharacterized Zn-finger protein
MAKPMSIEHFEGGFTVDAGLLGDLLALPPAQVMALMRRHEITSVCERGEGEHLGLYRLTFTHGKRRLRLGVDEAGKIVSRTVIDLGGQAPPRRVPTPAAKRLPLWRLRPVSAPADARWQGRRIWAEVVVRAASAAMARHLAAGWSRARPRRIGNETPAGGSGLEDFGLYSVSRLDPADEASEGRAEAQAGVIRAAPAAEASPGLPGQAELIRVGSRRFACDGGGGALGHPRVWYDLSGEEPLTCAYCSRSFVYDPEAHGPASPA